MTYRWITLFIGLGLHHLFAGSILSSQGIGLPYDNPNVRSMGMGFASIANPSPSRIDAVNPAGMTQISTTTLTIQSVFHTNKYKDTEYQSRSNYTNFDGFHFIVPFGKGLCAAFGLKPVTRIDYKIAFADQIESEEYTKSLKGSGGVNRFVINAAWAPVDRISIGVGVSYLMGRLIEESRNQFNADSDYTSSHDRISTHANGLNWTLGMQIRPYRSWTLGAIYSPSVHLDTQVDFYQIFSSSALDPGSLQYPSTYGIGISYTLLNTVIIAADFQKTQWEQLQINGADVLRTQNSHRISMGLEKIASADPYANYLKRIPLRVGALIQPCYILDPNGESLSEMWATFGFGFPVFHNTSHIDMMFGIGKRGSLEKNGLEEDLIRFGLSITGGEKWFRRKY